MRFRPPVRWCTMLPLRMLGFVLLILAQCGAEDACPFNRFTLDPPVIIQEYGSEASVNCTSTDKFEEMHLQIGNKTISKEVDRDYIAHTWVLEEWDVSAECRIKLNESHECTRKAEITVYQNPKLNLYIVEENASKEETQFKLRCEVIDAAPAQNLTVMWYKNDDIIPINSSSEVTKEPVNITSILMVNISREENMVSLRCEAMLDLGPQGPKLPVLFQTRNVSALYAPEVRTNTKNDITVSKGDNITLTCDVDGNPPPHFEWRDDVAIVSEDTNKLYVPQVDHNTTYNCTATNDLGSATIRFHVQVAEEATPNRGKQRDCHLTLTPSESVVRFGDPLVINCSTSDRDVEGMGWEATVDGTSFVPNIFSTTWRVEKVESWTLKGFCYDTLHHESCIKNASITIYKTPDYVSIIPVVSGPMTENETYELRCDVMNVAPVKDLRVKWYQGNKTVFTDSFKNTSLPPANLSSTWTFTPKKSDDGSIFRCEADLQVKPKEPEFLPPVSSPIFIAIVHYKPVLKNCQSDWHVAENESSIRELPCEFDGNPPPTVEWRYQGKPVNRNELLHRNHSGEYKAEVTNGIGTTEASVFITVEYRPSFDCKKQYEANVNGERKVPCEPEGIPPPSITWLKNGKEMVSTQPWTQEDSGNYTLRATNRHGIVEHAFYLDVLYAPQFKDGNTSIKVTPGENVTLECSVEGNPKPDVEWKPYPAKKVREATRGRQITITVTGATSTYTCVATNKVGTVTRYVSLVQKGVTHDPSDKLWWLCLLIIPIIVVIYYFLQRCKKKHGHYNFVPKQEILLMTNVA